MGSQVWGVIGLAIGLLICCRQASGEEPAPIKKLILPGEAFLVQDRPAFILLPREGTPAAAAVDPLCADAERLSRFPREVDARAVSGGRRGGGGH